MPDNPDTHSCRFVEGRSNSRDLPIDVSSKTVRIGSMQSSKVPTAIIVIAIIVVVAAVIAAIVLLARRLRHNQIAKAVGQR